MNDQSDVVKIARVFSNGRSRAIRIPKEFEFEEESVEIRKAENGDLIIHPVRKKTLLEILDELEELGEDEQMPEIDDPPPEPVDLFEWSDET
ncbi:antitoxin [Rhizobium sp. SG2393]|uniref:antitoxin n=1 Tax=Rhizobium sp. SG2393 TaxID=3276279 RepID=UPI0036731E80